MGLVAATTAGLVIWIVLWALGAKGFDAFMITTLVIVLGVGARIVAPALPGNRNG